MIYYLFFTHIASYWCTVFLYTYLLKQWKDETFKVATNVIINQFLVTPLYWFPYQFYPDTFSYHHGVWQLPAIILLTDVIFYIMHRIFHWQKILYTRIHERHHKYDPPVASAALYAHPVEHLFINLGSTVLPMFLVRCSFEVAIVWTLIASINVVVAHTTLHGGQHALHHKYKTCNFGVGPMLMDKIFKTYR